VDANLNGALSVTRNDAQVHIGISAVSHLNDQLIVRTDGEVRLRKNISLSPLTSFEVSVDIPADSPLEVDLGTRKLFFSTADAAKRVLTRPLYPNIDFDWSSAYGLATEAEELSRQRRYAEALQTFEKSLTLEPSYTPALIGMAELSYRRMEYDQGMDYALLALGNDTYDPAANFIYGALSRKLGRLYDAMDAFGIAAAQESHRAAATIELAEISLMMGRPDNMIHMLKRVEDLGPRYARVSRDLRQLSGLFGTDDLSISALGDLDQSYYANRYVLDPNASNAEALQNSIRNELPHESYIELAAQYVSLNKYTEAGRLLKLSPHHPSLLYWKAYVSHLLKDERASREYLEKAISSPIDLVFFHRAEELGMLLWAENMMPHWKTKYHLAVLLWSVGRIEEADAAFRAVRMDADAYIFYLARGTFALTTDVRQAEIDFTKALAMNTHDWRPPRVLGQLYAQQGAYQKSLSILSEARERFSRSYIIQFDYARSLMMNGRPIDAMTELEQTTLLPFEGARIGRDIWNQACILSALHAMKAGDWATAVTYITKARTWPERLGVGKPDVVDERIEDFLEGICRTRLAEDRAAAKMFAKVVAAPLTGSAADLLSAFALRERGDDKAAAEHVEQFARLSATEAGYWGKAVFDNARAVREGFEKEFTSRRNSGAWNMIDDDTSFPLVYAICSDLYY
jgi:tetratricopeptide (TPR) repeat protein